MARAERQGHKTCTATDTHRHDKNGGEPNDVTNEGNLIGIKKNETILNQTYSHVVQAKQKDRWGKKLKSKHSLLLNRFGITV